jgi:uncharacterized protein (DUF488 family)
MKNLKVLMTIGYEGFKPEGFLEKLKENNVSLLVDVRQNPISRKRGFSKAHLEILLQENNINYIHFQKLGTPRELRNHLKEDGDYEGFFEEYKDYLMNQKGWLDYLKGLVEKTTCCLMCFEKDHQECHRQVISSTLEEMSDNNLEVVHI